MKIIILSLLFAIFIYPQSNLLLLLGDDAVFTPLDVSTATIVAWYDASDTSTITQESNLVSQWEDKSGNNNHLTAATTEQPTYNTKTQNSLGVIDFVPADNMDKASFSGFNAINNELTLFVVAKFDNVSSRTLITSQAMGVFCNGTNIQFNIAGGNPAEYAFTDVTNYHIWSFVHRQANRTVYDNGVSKNTNSSAQVFSSTSIKLNVGALDNGTTWAMDGSLAELIIYKGYINDAERIKVEKYLNDKWAVY